MSDNATADITEETAAGKVGWRGGVKIVIGSAVPAVVLFVSAGRVDLPRAWVFAVAFFAAAIIGTMLVEKFSPGLLKHRLEWRKKQGTKRWDKFLLPAFGIVGFYIPLVVMGLDVGRYGWSHLGLAFAAAGVALLAAGSVAMYWAMCVNRHFEGTVRIQTERRHRVITGGPYRIVRHPGYVGALGWVIAPPLIVGSAWALVPVAVAVVLLIIRTALEDRMLRNELDGYADYARRVRYRLVPGLW